MVQITLWHDVTRDPKHLPEYLKAMGVDHLACDSRHVSTGRDPAKISPPLLRKVRKNLAREGIDLSCVTVGWVRAETLDDRRGGPVRKKILQNIEALGKAGVRVAQLFVMVEAGSELEVRTWRWNRLVAFSKEVAKVASKAKVKVGVHGSEATTHLLANLRDYKKFMAAVPSKWFGITLCLGCLKINGSDPARCVRELGSRMFFLHARDVIMHRDGSWTDVNLGLGEVDYPAVRKAVEKVGYSGPFQPEHLGSVSFEKGEEITMARAVGFMRGVFTPAPAVRKGK